MPETVFSVGAVAPSDVAKVFDVLKQVIAAGKVVAGFTPTSVDNDVLDKIDATIAYLEPVLQKEGVLELFNMVLDLFHRGTSPALLLEAIKKVGK